MKTKSTKRSSEPKSKISQPQNLSRQRRKRTFFTNEQLDRLEEVFQKERFPGITTREALTEELGIKEDRIQVWFQNRRARWRKREIKNKPAPKSDKAQPVTAWPESRFPSHPQIATGFTTLLPFAPWLALPEDADSVNPTFPFTNPLTYNALQFPLPPVLTSANSETSSISPHSSSDHPSPTEPNEQNQNRTEPDGESERKDCRPSESPRSCGVVPSSYLGRSTHSLDEYNAAIGLLSVFERQD